jgi:hypothetical protein
MGAVALGLVVYFGREDSQEAGKVALSRGEEDERKLDVQPTEGFVERGVARPSTAGTGATVAPAASTAVGNGRLSCQSDDECRGPKTATCVVPKCMQGQCKYDNSTCECDGPEDCDDGEPCTSDVCFSSTRKCVHVQLDDCM